MKNPLWILCTILLLTSAAASGIEDTQAAPGQPVEQANQPAKPATNDKALNTAPTSAPDNSAPATTVPATSSLDALTIRFPSLQRALLILTIINFVIIVFGLMMYLVKRRMQQFSPAPMVRLNQEG